jgi:molybdenum cofactor cytidylyltransferase
MRDQLADSAAQWQVAAIVLAAGRSSRMGQHKLLLPLGGQPLLAHTVAAACSSSADPVIVVLGRDAAEVADALPPGRWSATVNADYARGMASSLQRGLAAVPVQMQGTLILLGDQPLVTTPLIEAVLGEARHHADSIIAASYAGARGHPIYFPQALFAELRELSGDEGGRSVIARHADILRLVAWPDAHAALDVDTPGSYEALLRMWPAEGSA